MKASLILLGGLLSSLTASAQISTNLLNEGDLIPGAGHVATSFHAIDTNEQGGFAIHVRGLGKVPVSIAWGTRTGSSPSEILTGGIHAGLMQGYWDTTTLGFADSGSVAYSTVLAGGLGSVWIDDALLAVGDDPASVPGHYWRSFYWTSMAASGDATFYAHLADAPGGPKVLEGVFHGPSLTPLLLGGDVIPGLPEPLAASPSPFDGLSFSADGAHWIAVVVLASGARAVVLDGQGYTVDGELIAEGQLVPPSLGGDGADVWAAVYTARVSNAGSVTLLALDTGHPTRILVDGTTAKSFGDVIDGYATNSLIRVQRNEAGQIAFRTYAGGESAIVVDDTIVARVGDAVDFDRDGVVDPGAVITSLGTGAPNNFRLAADGSVYYAAEVDVNDTPADPTDDVEGLYRAAYDPLGPNTYCTASVSADGCLAQISGVGQPSVTPGGTFDVRADDVPAGAIGVLVYTVFGPDSVPFQGGTLCVGQPLKRSPVQFSMSPTGVGCDGAYDYDFQALIDSGTIPQFVAGAEVWTQYVYRDPATAGATVGLSNGLRFVVRP